jgi:glutamate-5-semialdehyde dehydrogenase
VLIHQDVSDSFAPVVIRELHDAGVRLHGDAKIQEYAKKLGIEVISASEGDWSTEYGILEMNLAIVPSLDAASEHILQYGTQHTESIVTESESAADRFVALSDCAAVMVNASTRFTDGEEMGFGAEIGISNQKLHARGPMGLEAMTTTTWIVKGDGQIRK